MNAYYTSRSQGVSLGFATALWKVIALICLIAVVRRMTQLHVSVQICHRGRNIVFLPPTTPHLAPQCNDYCMQFIVDLQTTVSLLMIRRVRFFIYLI